MIVGVLWLVCPVPARPTKRGEPGAVLVIETFPLALPDAVGANVTLKIAVPPGVNVCGDSVLILKPAPLALAALIDRLAVPEFVTVTLTDAVLPTSMLPKLTLDGFAVKAGCVPVPLKPIASSEFVAVELTVTLPEALPGAVGAKVATRVAVAPATMLWPAVTPLTLNPVPAAVTLLIVMVLLPEFVSVIG